MSAPAPLDDHRRDRPFERRDGAGVPHPCWDAALGAAVQAAKTQRLTAVIGGPGTGKTMLLARVFADLTAEGASVTLVRNAAMHDQSGTGILLLDEADKLSPQALQSVCAQAAHCVLAGLPQLSAALEALQTPATRIVLAPLQPHEVAGFVHALLRRDVGDDTTIDDAAIALLAEHSAGVPRNLRILIGLARLTTHAQDGRRRIEARHVEAGARLRYSLDDGEPDVSPLKLDSLAARALEPAASDEPAPSALKRSPGRTRRLVVAGALAATLLAAALALQPELRRTTAATPPAAPAPAPAVSATPQRVESAAALTDPAQVAEAAPAAHSPAATPAAGREAVPVGLPEAAAPLILITYPERDPAGLEQAKALASDLVGRGAAVGGIRAQASPGQGGVLFFFAEDAPRARALASDLDRPVRQGPRPIRPDEVAPGAIEIVLPSTPRPPASDRTP